MKVIFLDIDGVIQPLWQQKRFEHIDEIEELAKKLDARIPGYSYFDYVTKEEYPESKQSLYSRKCNLGAVCFDWSEKAIYYLRDILEKHNAMIVISSDWRDFGERTVRSFLAIYDLDEYLYGMLDGISYAPPTESQKKARAYYESIKAGSVSYDERAADIRDYLDIHPEITAYVAVDDRNLGFPVAGHFVYCNDGVIDERKHVLMKELIDIEAGPYPLE